MRNQREVLPEINMSAVAEHIQAWYTKQKESIPSKIENAIENSPEAVQNKARERTIAYLSALNEIATTELVFIEQTQLLQTKLEGLIKTGRNRLFFRSDKANIALLNAYLAKVSALVAAQNRSFYFNCYQDDKLGAVETNLYQFFSSDDFKTYLDAVINLGVEYEKIRPILPNIILPSEQSAYKFDRSPVALAGSSMQRITRYKDLIDNLVSAKKKLNNNATLLKSSSISDEISDATLALKCTKEYADKYNQKLGYLKGIKQANQEMTHLRFPNRLSGTDKQNRLKYIVLDKILSLNLGTMLQKDEHYHGYVQTLLTHAYPEFFAMSDTRFVIQTIQHDKGNALYTKINTALGYDISQPNAIETRIDTRQLNKDMLTQLYNETKNPLWLVLKSTKPIDDTFTANDKIDAYRELGVSCFNREIVNRSEKYPLMLKLTKAAYIVASEHPSALKNAREGFTPDDVYAPPSEQDDKKGFEQYIRDRRRFGNWVRRKYLNDEGTLSILSAQGLDEQCEKMAGLQKLLESLTLQQNSIDAEIIEITSSSMLTAAAIEIAPESVQLIEGSLDDKTTIATLKREIEELRKNEKSSQKQINLLRVKQVTSNIIKENAQNKSLVLSAQIQALEEKNQQLDTERENLSSLISKQEEDFAIIPPSENQEASFSLVSRINNLFAFLREKISPHDNVVGDLPSSTHTYGLISVNRSTSSSFFKSASLFSDIKREFMQKFKGTNSSGINRLIELMEKAKHSNDNDNLLFILMNMRQISKERADLTLPKLGIMNRGRRRDAQTFYDAMKTIDLSTEAGKQSAIATLTHILSESSNNLSLRTSRS